MYPGSGSINNMNVWIQGPNQESFSMLAERYSSFHFLLEWSFLITSLLSVSSKSTIKYNMIVYAFLTAQLNTNINVDIQ